MKRKGFFIAGMIFSPLALAAGILCIQLLAATISLIAGQGIEALAIIATLPVAIMFAIIHIALTVPAAILTGLCFRCTNKAMRIIAIVAFSLTVVLLIVVIALFVVIAV